MLVSQMAPVFGLRAEGLVEAAAGVRGGPSPISPRSHDERARQRCRPDPAMGS